MNLNDHEYSVYSQNGEDGILQAIFNEIGTDDKFFVEFGVETGVQCNTALLSKQYNWSGLLIEGSKEYCRTLRENYSGLSNVSIRESFITKENIIELFEEENVPSTFDLLSVDIDGNDYWVLKEILKKYRPSVIICEYNAFYAPPIKWIMKYNSSHIWDGTSYQGASLSSLESLCSANGYSLVCTDRRGVNAFFVKNKKIGNLQPKSAIEAYHSAGYYGHLNNGHLGHPFKDGEFIEI